MVRRELPRSPKEGFSLLGWYHFKIFVPETWEITQYGIDEVEGRLEFCNRQWHQGRLSWKKGKLLRKPDLEKTLEENHRRFLLKDHKDEVNAFRSLATQMIGPFLFAHGRDDRPCQAATYLEDEQTVLIWTFPKYTPSVFKDTIEPILRSFNHNDESDRYWSAFGLSFWLDKDFDLEDAAVLPGDICLNFEHKNRHQVNLHRWGLPEELLRGQDMKTFYYRVLGGRKDKVLTMDEESFKGMDSVKVTLTRSGTHAMDKLYGGEWPGEGRIWYNRGEQRLYAYEQAAPKKLTLLKEETLLC